LIDNFIVDFYCPKLKLVIEVDGDSHFTDLGLVYDEERTLVLEGYGLQIIRLINDAILTEGEDSCVLFSLLFLKINSLK
jgi:very-short-patch-repair endonuclease